MAYGNIHWRLIVKQAAISLSLEIFCPLYWP